jgi:hypothetical protein
MLKAAAQKSCFPFCRRSRYAAIAEVSVLGDFPLARFLARLKVIIDDPQRIHWKLLKPKDDRKEHGVDSLFPARTNRESLEHKRKFLRGSWEAS